MIAVKTIPALLFCSIFLSMLIPDAHSAEADQDQLAYAQSLAREGNIDEAIEQYLIYHANNPDEHLVLETISGLYKRSKRYKEAIEFAEKFLVSGETHLTKGAHFRDQCNRILELWKKASGSKLAREHYLTILENEKTTPRMKIVAELMLGDIEISSKNYAASKEYYMETLNSISPLEDEWQMAVSDALLYKFIRKQNYDDALTAYKNHPNYGHLQQLGYWLRRQGRGFEMVELY